MDDSGHLQLGISINSAPRGVLKTWICVGDRLLCSLTFSMLASLGIRYWDTPCAFSAIALARESFAASRSRTLALLAPSSAVRVLTPSLVARQSAVLPNF